MQYKQYMIDKNMAPQEDGVATATAPSHEGGTGKSTLGQPQLSKQDLATLDISKLTPLSPEVISRQVTSLSLYMLQTYRGRTKVARIVSAIWSYTHSILYRQQLT